MKLQPYLFFEGRCEEAILFYQEKLGAETTMMMRFNQMPGPTDPNMPVPPGEKIMHATLKVGDSVFHVSDGQCRSKDGFHGFQMSLTASSPAEAERVFAALADGGQITMPLTKTFFSSAFGMANDRFGVPWSIMVG